MTLLLNEHEVLTSNENQIILTNKRIQMTQKDWGRSYKISIFLEDISSTQVLYKSNIVWLVLGIFSLVYFALALIQNDRFSYYDKAPMQISLVVGLIFLALYWFSRRHIISIHSDGGKPLEFMINRMSDAEIEHFFDKVQSSKHDRMNELFKQ
jgi:hypothetical protein